MLKWHADEKLSTLWSIPKQANLDVKNINTLDDYHQKWKRSSLRSHLRKCLEDPGCPLLNLPETRWPNKPQIPKLISPQDGSVGAPVSTSWNVLGTLGKFVGRHFDIKTEIFSKFQVISAAESATDTQGNQIVPRRHSRCSKTSLPQRSQPWNKKCLWSLMAFETKYPQNTQNITRKREFNFDIINMRGH